MTSTGTKKLIAAVVAVFLLIVAGVFFYLIFSGPHMIDQPRLRAFQAEFPLPPPGVVPVGDPNALPSEERAGSLRSTLADTPENRARGGVYYDYYCLFCHNTDGGGDATVGQSFIPAVPDLRSEKVRNFSDGELLRAMLTGPGHEPMLPGFQGPPVLQYTVPPEHRWYLVLYVRALAEADVGQAGNQNVE